MLCFQYMFSYVCVYSRTWSNRVLHSDVSRTPGLIFVNRHRLAQWWTWTREFSHTRTRNPIKVRLVHWWTRTRTLTIGLRLGLEQVLSRVWMYSAPGMCSWEFPRPPLFSVGMGIDTDTFIDTDTATLYIHFINFLCFRINWMEYLLYFAMNVKYTPLFQFPNSFLTAITNNFSLYITLRDGNEILLVIRGQNNDFVWS